MLPRTRAPLVPWPRTALAVTTGAVVVFVALGAVVWHDDNGLAVDNAFHDWVLRTFDVVTRVDMVDLTDRWLVVSAAAIIAVVALLGRRVDVAVLCIVGPLAATGLTEYVLKPVVDRNVPLAGRLTGIEAKAYPSGHETAVSSVLVLLALILLRSRLTAAMKIGGLVALAAYYVVTVFGLVGQYFHYLTDTIGALAVAIAVVLGGALAIDRIGR